MKLFVLLCPLLVIVGCSSKPGTAGGTAKYRIAVIPKGTTHDHWKAVRAGAQQVQGLQIIHLTGAGNYSRVEQAYRGWQGRVLVKDFAAEMETIMGAATLAITRAGASTLAELAASGLASVLVPYPRASDNHQYYNARALADTGSARMMEEAAASPAALASTVREMVDNAEARRLMREALSRWHRPEAALQIAAEIMERIGMTLLKRVETRGAPRLGVTRESNAGRFPLKAPGV